VSTEEAVHEPIDEWAAVEALALVSADQALVEHRVGELAREERRREGADESPPRRRGFSQ